MRFRLFACVMLPVLLFFPIACSTKNAATNTGTGLLYFTAQGNATISAYTVNLSNGSLTQVGSSVPTGLLPSAIAITPSINALFVANSGDNTISSYTLNSDGSLTQVSGTAPSTHTTPVSLTIDPAGKFLFVANQGSNDISVFSINGTSLKEVAGSPFTTIAQGTTQATGPSSVAVPPAGNFLYVANRFTNTVSAFKFDGTSGALTAVPNSPYAVGTSPTAVAVFPAGGFLLVANGGSNDISSFAICAAASATCVTPDGTLTPVVGSPFSAGQGPVAIAFNPAFNFVYVADEQSNQISGYSFGAGNGKLTPLATPFISTGQSPVSLAVHSGATGSNIGSTTLDLTDYVYVANFGASTLSAFSLGTSSGVLSPLGTPLTTPGQPSAVAVK